MKGTTLWLTKSKALTDTRHQLPAKPVDGEDGFTGSSSSARKSTTSGIVRLRSAGPVSDTIDPFKRTRPRCRS